ncbi:MAG: nucleotide exchange factor GrpE [Chthoniobacterales bacterium]|nr:nucleotide exchange factor GrpE [Chthoniobacterales bacterium]
MKKNPTPDPTSKQEATSQEEIPVENTVPSVDSAPIAPKPNLQAEVERYRDQALRAAADLENYRKRMIREKEEAIRFANAGLLEKLLPILDNFELGLTAASGDTAAKGIVDGFAIVHRQLGDFLVSSGLQPIDAVGQPFDPKLHEALGHETDAAQADGVVLRQLRRGYRLADRLIRPSSVIVNKLA